MGRGMAANLVKAGHSVIVYDVTPGAVSELGKAMVHMYLYVSYIDCYIVLYKHPSYLQHFKVLIQDLMLLSTNF